MLRQETPQYNKSHLHKNYFVQHLTQCEIICLRIINSFTFGIKLTSTIRYNMMIIRISRVAFYEITIYLFIFPFNCENVYFFCFSSLPYIFLIIVFRIVVNCEFETEKDKKNWKVISSHHTITHICIERKIKE